MGPLLSDYPGNDERGDVRGESLAKALCCSFHSYRKIRGGLQGGGGGVLRKPRPLLLLRGSSYAFPWHRRPPD